MKPLTEKQLTAFKNLWFIYGNHGKKSTLFNHKLVQGFYEAQEDRRDAYNIDKLKANIIEKYGETSIMLKDLPTEECFKVCELVLDNKIDEVLKIAKT